MYIKKKVLRSTIIELAYSNNPDYSDMLKAIKTLYCYDLISKEDYDEIIDLNQRLGEVM